MPVTQTPAPETKPERLVNWQRRVLGFCVVIFTFELGVFLVVFPWLKNWDMSWIAVHSQRFSDLWMSPYFRGALSGLGLLDIYVAFSELIRQLKLIFGE